MNNNGPTPKMSTRENKPVPVSRASTRLPKRKPRSGVAINHTMDLATYLPFRFFEITRKLAFSGKIEIDGVAVSVRDWRVLALLASAGPLTNSELADNMGMDAATITRAVKFLRSNGLVDVQPSKRDRRSQLIALSQKGADIYDDIAPERIAFAKNVEACLTAAERDNLYSALDKIDAFFAAREATQDEWD